MRVALEDTAIVDPDTYVAGVPHELFASLRARGAAVWVDEPPIDNWPPGPGFWAVVQHGEAARVLRTPSMFSSSAGLTQLYDAPPPLLPALRTMMLNMDPPEHSRLRGLITRSFTPRAVALLESRIRQHAAQLVAAAADKPTCDFARDVAAELPLFTLSEVLGVPESDRWLMFDWANRVIGLLDDEYRDSSVFDASAASEMAQRALQVRPKPDENGKMPDSRRPEGMADLYAYARELGEYRRRHPGDDVMSMLMQQVDDDGGRVSVDEFERLFWLFSIAGNETVRNALPGGMYALTQHPEVYDRLRAERCLLDRAVEEMLRWWTPVIHFRRTAVEDTVIGDAKVRAGDKVMVFFSSANRDETVFADPHAFDLDRDPNPHLAFGHGPHFCVAAHLARVQMRAMFAAVLDHFEAVSLAGEPVRLRSNFQNGIKHLPIEWRHHVVR